MEEAVVVEVVVISGQEMDPSEIFLHGNVQVGSTDLEAAGPWVIELGQVYQLSQVNL